MTAFRRATVLVVVSLAGGLIVQATRRTSLARLRANVRRYSAPSVGFYDSLAARFLGGLYRQVVRETADLRPRGTLLDVGSGPGRLAVALAQAYPELRVVSVDLSPEMVGRAREVAQEAGLGGRLRFEAGDVGSLPFADASFETVLSTLSMHHWPDPQRGLAEVHRVLKPGGVARIYDVVDWIRHVEQRGVSMVDLAARSPFGGGRVETVVRLGPIPILQRVELRRGPDAR